MVGLKLMAQAVQTLPNAPVYHNNLGELLRMMGRFQEAEAEFRTSLRLNPRDSGIVSTLALTLAQQGKTAEGLEAAKAAIGMSPQSPAPHFRLGMIHAQMKQYAEARACYEKALTLDPTFGHAADAMKQLPADAK
jgi:tetratricopeptide (TPR) repeat protein